MIEVVPSASFSRRIRLAITLSEIGSRPAKGSSYIASIGSMDDGARQRHAPYHAAGEFARHQVARAAQPDHVQLHQDQRAYQLLRQVGVFAQRKRDVLVHRQVGEQAARPGTSCPSCAAADRGCRCRVRAPVRRRPRTVPRAGFSWPPIRRSSVDLPQPLAPEYGDHLAARNLEGEALEDFAVAVIELDLDHFDDVLSGGFMCHDVRFGAT